MTTEPESSTTTPPTREPSATTTATEPSAADVVALRADGLGPVDFGTPEEEAVAALTEQFGVPDIDETGEAPRGGYDHFPAIERHRFLVWHRYGLGVELTDWGGSRSAPPTPLHLAMWSVSGRPEAVEASTLRTAEGLGVGATAADLRTVAPDTQLGFDINVTFTADLPGGPVWGRFDWPEAAQRGEPAPGFYRALQAALNDHGADLAVDGICGPRTTSALVEFADSQGIDGAVVQNGQPKLDVPLFTAWWQLGLPPDHVPVDYLHAGDDEVASQPSPTGTQPVILRPDGLGDHDFGEPASELVPEPDALLGPPSSDSSETPSGPGRLTICPSGSMLPTSCAS